MKNYKATELIARHISGREKVVLDSIQLSDDLTISKSIFSSDIGELHFKNCEFKKLTFFSVEAMQISFSNCKIEELRIMNSTIQSFSCQGNTIIAGKLELITSTIDSIQLLKTQILYGDWTCSNLNNTLIHSQDLHLKEGKLFLVDCKIETSLYFFNLWVEKGYCSIINSTVEHAVSILSGKINGALKIAGLTCNNSFTINHTSIGDCIDISDSSFKQEFHLTAGLPVGPSVDGKVERALAPAEISIMGSVFEGGLFMEGKYEKGFRSHIKELQIFYSEKQKGNIHINNFLIDNIKLEGTLHQSNLYLRTIATRQVEILNFTNFGTLQFYNLRAQGSPSVFAINNADLGNTNFFDVDFNSFDAVIITRSLLTKITTSNVLWSPRVALSSEGLPKTTNDFRQLRETYRQLKYALRNNGDTIKSLKFEGLEMEAYRNQLQTGGGSYGERLILWSNQSNDYGQNWLKPFWLLLLGNLFFYIMITYCAEFHFTQQLNIGAEIHRFATDVVNSFGKYFHLLNPLHVLRFMYPKTWLNNWVLFWDMLSRVVNAYFIYQMISAFRKYSKR